MLPIDCSIVRMVLPQRSDHSRSLQNLDSKEANPDTIFMSTPLAAIAGEHSANVKLDAGANAPNMQWHAKNAPSVPTQ